MKLYKIIRDKIKKSRVNKVYKNNDFLTAYKLHSDMRVGEDYQNAIGGKWDEIGILQFEFMKKYGLKPDDSFLDFGCGTLRGGRFFIKYLNKNCYTGIDISPKIIEKSKEIVKDLNLDSKFPTLILNSDLDLQFKDLEGKKFKFILAQSVFTHLKPIHIDEIFNNLKVVMKEDSCFFFTYNQGEKFEEISFKDFKYSSSFFKSLAQKNGYSVREINDYPHPSGQKMVKLTYE